MKAGRKVDMDADMKMAQIRAKNNALVKEMYDKARERGLDQWLQLAQKKWGYELISAGRHIAAAEVLMQYNGTPPTDDLESLLPKGFRWEDPEAWEDGQSQIES